MTSWTSCAECALAMTCAPARSASRSRSRGRGASAGRCTDHRWLHAESAAYRAQIRPHLIELAGGGELVVPVARTFPLEEAPQALTLLQSGHPGGKLALIP